MSSTLISYEDLIVFPPLDSSKGSLRPLERSLLAHFIILVRPSIIIELGVFEAVTTEFMCDFIALNKINARVIGFDVPEVIQKLRETNATVQKLESEGRLQLIPGWLPDSLDEWLKQTGNSIDLALVDAMHDYRSVTGELKRIWSRLAPDGFVLCHDYSLKYEGVRYAVDNFAAQRKLNVLPLTPSVRAEELGYNSVLVALSQRKYEFSLIRWCYHLWISTKQTLMMNPLFKSLWIGWIKPLIKRGINEPKPL